MKAIGKVWNHPSGLYCMVDNPIKNDVIDPSIFSNSKTISIKLYHFTIRFIESSIFMFYLIHWVSNAFEDHLNTFLWKFLEAAGSGYGILRYALIHCGVDISVAIIFLSSHHHEHCHDKLRDKEGEEEDTHAITIRAWGMFLYDVFYWLLSWQFRAVHVGIRWVCQQIKNCIHLIHYWQVDHILIWIQWCTTIQHTPLSFDALPGMDTSTAHFIRWSIKA